MRAKHEGLPAARRCRVGPDQCTEDIALIKTPLAMQPTEYIRKSWKGRNYGGGAKSVKVASVHDGATWAIRLSWTG